MFGRKSRMDMIAENTDIEMIKEKIGQKCANCGLFMCKCGGSDYWDIYANRTTNT